MYKAIEDAINASGYGAELRGRMPFSVVKGIVSNNTDPENKRRIRATTALVPGIDSQWLYRVNIMPGSDPPLPKIGQTVLIIYEEANPLKGFYVTIENKANPPQGKIDVTNDWYLMIPGVINILASELPIKVTLEGDTVTVIGNLEVEAPDTIELTSGDIINLDALATISLDALTSITLTAPLVLVEGHLQIEGSAIVLGNITVEGLPEYTLPGDTAGTYVIRGNVQIENATSFSINGKQVATIDADVDPLTDKVITKGWQNHGN